MSKHRYLSPQNNFRPHYQHKVNHGARVPFRGNNFPRHRFSPPTLQPGNTQHWCETCDRGFHTAELLNRHLQEHQKCNIDGCQFVAHPIVVTKHIQMQHSSGLYKKIANLNNPEEIQKWREERKKKYPTISNIEKKAAEIKEKVDRGEKMGLKRERHFGKNKQGTENRRHHNAPNEKYNKRFNRNNISNQNKNHKITKNYPPKNIPKILPSVESKNKLLSFTGILGLVVNEQEDVESTHSNSNNLIEDDDDDLEMESIDTKETLTSCKPIVCGALSSLMCQYGSSDEESNIETNNTSLSKILTNDNNFNQNTKLLKNPLQNKLEINIKETNKSDEDSGPEEVKVIKNQFDSHEEPKQTKHVISKKITNVSNLPKKAVYRRPKPKIPSTLLHKLLSKEIRQERNIILQCIRHIKKNNYFDK